MERINLSQYGMASDKAFDPEALGRLKADTINEMQGHLSEYDCPKCKNRGIFAVPKGSSVGIYECGCMRIRKCLIKMSQSGLKKVIEDKTFDKFQTESRWQAEIKRGAVNYADKPDGWLLFCGQTGSGKTHLCTAICRKLLLDGCEVRYMPWRDDIAQLKALSLDCERRENLIQELKKAQVLFIDDLFKTGKSADGTSNPTRADIDLAFEIINYRYVSNLLTIISTEKDPAELLRIDEATAGRIIEKAKNNIFQIKRDPSRNYRLRSVAEI